MTTVRCTIEMDMEQGKHFVPESDNAEDILAAAVWAFVEILDNDDIFDYIQTKIIEDVS